MKDATKEILKELIQRYPQLGAVQNDVERAYVILEEAYRNGNKVLICGNGGSASDSEHIVGELLKSFKKKRAISMKAVHSS